EVNRIAQVHSSVPVQIEERNVPALSDGSSPAGERSRSSAKELEEKRHGIGNLEGAVLVRVAGKLPAAERRTDALVQPRRASHVTRGEAELNPVDKRHRAQVERLGPGVLELHELEVGLLGRVVENLGDPQVKLRWERDHRRAGGEFDRL